MTDFLEAIGTIIGTVTALVLIVAITVIGLWPVWLALAAIKYLLT